MEKLYLKLDTKSREHETKEVQRPNKQSSKESKAKYQQNWQNNKVQIKRAKYKSNPRFKPSAKRKNSKTHTKET